MKGKRFQWITILLTVCIMLLWTFIVPLEAEASSFPEFIKIGLKYGSTGPSDCTLSSKSGFVLGTITEEGFKETLPLPAYSTVVASIENGHVALHDQQGVLLSANIGVNGCLAAADYKENGLITYENADYRGGMLLLVNSSNKLSIINYLKTEEYLYGVIHREMSQSFPIEALKAQAVAARSFVMESYGRHTADGFDVCSSTHCQVYGGYNAEYPSTCQAVNETKGLLVWSKGEPAPVFYHKNSGGHTQSIGEVWSFPMNHLTGKVDPYSPNYPWSATIYFNTLEQKLTRAGYLTGSIQSVKIGGRNSAGAVSKLIIEGNKDTVNLEKEKIRSVLGTSLVRSRHFNIGTEYLGRDGMSSLIADFQLSNGRLKKDVGEKVYVLSAGDKLKEVNSAELHITNGNKTIKAKTTETPSDTPDSVVATGDKVIFTGVGSGHGVGMSQDGAIEMAKQGFTFDQILHFYYTDIEVR